MSELVALAHCMRWSEPAAEMTFPRVIAFLENGPISFAIRPKKRLLARISG
jgi:hypothetical protein